jgi:alanyl-tRNA synthetase
MAQRLYYQDSFLREFDAQVLSVEPAPAHSGRAPDALQWHVVLDRTAFYPTSGGQPHDTGKLADTAVLDVFERHDQSVVHVTGQVFEIGAVHGVIDWERRFDHMQQHTGQHLLSAAFLELFKLPTVSFHLGREVSTIDLSAAEIEPEQLEQAEHRVNQIVCEDRPVTVRFGTAEELAKAGIRKKVEREGLLRAIEVEDFDRQPCGGTHVARTGQIGLVLIRKCEKVKQDWRVEFVSGGRSARAARCDLMGLGKAARQLNCGLAEVPGMVARAVKERQAGHRARQRLEEQLAEVQALLLLATEALHNYAGGPRVLVRLFDEAGGDYLRLLATRLVAEPGVRALLASRAGGHVVFAQSPGLEADMNALLREVIEAAGGKGGGSKDFAQGSIANASAVETVLDHASERLRR